MKRKRFTEETDLLAFKGNGRGVASWRIVPGVRHKLNNGVQLESPFHGDDDR